MGSQDLLLEAGKSAELSAVFQTIAQCEIDGEAKYSPSVCREIGKMIVCRTYASPIMELCHLIVAASKLDRSMGRYEYFFWDSGIAQSSNFRNYCLNRTSSDLKIDHNGLTIPYIDTPFSVQYSRMPVLSALLEFLLTALGYSEIEHTLSKLFQHPLSAQQTSTCANALSRALYDYLRDHLPTAQSQRKFRKILAFCNNDIENSSDDTILQFWQEASLDNEKGVDFKTFDTTFLTFVRAIQAIETARDLKAMDHASSIGYEHDHGEINPDLLSETLDTQHETIHALHQLENTPISRVKFLNKKESAQLLCLLDVGSLALRLPLSVLRSDVFSKVQARLTQAMRRKADKPEIREIANDLDIESYQDRQISYSDLQQHLKRNLYASLHALVLAQSQQAISLLLCLSPNADYAALMPYLTGDNDANSNVVPLKSSGIAERFLSLLQDPDQVGEETAHILKQAEDAYNAISRKGFKDDIHHDEELITAFSGGATILNDIFNDIDAFLERLDSLPICSNDWGAQFARDQHLFSDQFNKIYVEGMSR